MGEQRSGGSPALVVGGLLGDVREEVPESALDEPEPAPLGVEAKHDLSHRQAGQFGVREPRWSSGGRTWPQEDEEVVDGDVHCAEEDVELGMHNSLFGVLAFPVTPPLSAPPGLESTI